MNDTPQIAIHPASNPAGVVFVTLRAEDEEQIYGYKQQKSTILQITCRKAQILGSLGHNSSVSTLSSSSHSEQR
jgi:hypothetical protein